MKNTVNMQHHLPPAIASYKHKFFRPRRQDLTERPVLRLYPGLQGHIRPGRGTKNVQKDRILRADLSGLRDARHRFGAEPRGCGAGTQSPAANILSSRDQGLRIPPEGVARQVFNKRRQIRQSSGRCRHDRLAPQTVLRRDCGPGLWRNNGRY